MRKNTTYELSMKSVRIDVICANTANTVVEIQQESNINCLNFKTTPFYYSKYSLFGI